MIQTIKNFIDTDAGAFCLASVVTALALVGWICAMWPDQVALAVFG